MSYDLHTQQIQTAELKKTTTTTKYKRKNKPNRNKKIT